MAYLFLISIFYIIYGIFGLFGKSKVAEKFKGYEWTKTYMRDVGIGDILFGIPWLIFYFACKQYDLSFGITIFLTIMLALPSLIYLIFTERKYLKLIKKD